MEIINFPNTRFEVLSDNASRKLSEWVELQIEVGLHPLVLIALLETCKAAMCYNLLEDYDDKTNSKRI